MEIRWVERVFFATDINFAVAFVNRAAMLNLVVHPHYQSLTAALRTVPQAFATSGKVLYSKRNEVRLLLLEGHPVVVKRFKYLHLCKSLIYRYLRSSKAERAYTNALQLLELGLSTPAPIAWMRHGRYYYFVSEPTDGASVKDELVSRQPVNRDMIVPYAHFVAKVHECGVWHRDFNPSNVLYHRLEDGSYAFELIDINRMRFYPQRAVPKEVCQHNFATLFWEPKGVFEDVLRAYAQLRGWSEQDVQDTIQYKYASNRAYIRRKRFAHFWKTLFKFSS